MRLFALLLSALICLNGESALAKTAAPAKKKQPAKAAKNVDRDADDTSGGDSSAAVRNAKPISATILYTPLSDFMLQFGAGGTYMLNRDIQLGFNFLTGSEDRLADINSTEDETFQFTQADLSGMAFYGYARYFFGDTFNASGGLGYRSGSIAYRFEDKVTGEYLEGDLSMTSIIVPVAIGNHWSWDSGLAIGVDWIAVMIPLSGSSESSTETTFAAAGDEVDDFNTTMLELGDELSKQTSLTLALVSIGYSF